MLYDQGQLLRSYSNFCKTSITIQDKELALNAIIDIASYLNTNLSHPVSFFKFILNLFKFSLVVFTVLRMLILFPNQELLRNLKVLFVFGQYQKWNAFLGIGHRDTMKMFVLTKLFVLHLVLRMKEMYLLLLLVFYDFFNS
jgi:hypothetical protein